MEYRKSYPTDAYLLVQLRNEVWKNTYYDVLPNRILHYMKENEIPLEINTEDIADTDGEEYFVRDISVVFPKCGGDINPYIAVYVEEM